MNFETCEFSFQLCHTLCCSYCKTQPLSGAREFDMLLLVEHLLLFFFIASLIGVYIRGGLRELLRVVLIGLKNIPGVTDVLAYVLRNEAVKFVHQSSIGGGNGQRLKITIPEKGEIETKDLRLICSFTLRCTYTDSLGKKPILVVKKLTSPRLLSSASNFT